MPALLLADLGRCARAAVAPSIALLTLTAALRLINHATPPDLIPVVAPLYLAILGATACAVMWLLVATAVSATQPRRDARAAERLAALHDRARVPGRVLVEIQHISWSSPAGQHIVAVDVTRGTRHEIWLPETVVRASAFVVLDVTAQPVRVVSWIDRRTVAAARRHATRTADRHAAAARRLACLRSRREKQAAADLVREAEDALRLALDGRSISHAQTEPLPEESPHCKGALLLQPRPRAGRNIRAPVRGPAQGLLGRLAWPVRRRRLRSDLRELHDHPVHVESVSSPVSSTWRWKVCCRTPAFVTRETRSRVAITGWSRSSRTIGTRVSSTTPRMSRPSTSR